jgi:hypothetical protein
LILFVALILRLGFAWDYQHHRPRQALSAIPFLFEPGNIAYSVANGKGFSSPFRAETGPTAWMTPVYPLLIAGIFKFFGIYTFGSFVAAAALNILCSTLTCAPIYAVSKRVGGLPVAAGAAWLWAVFPNAILLPFEAIWDTSLTTLLSAAILWATVVLAETQRLRAWCWYGLLWGFTLMTNATLLAVLPFLVGWLIYRVRDVKRPAVLVAIIVLCCVPWTVRNFLVFHRFVPLRSTLGVQLWVGNNERAKEWVPGRIHPISNSAERARYVELGEIRYSEEKQQAALQFMLSHPGEEAGLIGNRIVAVWTGGTPHPFTDFFQIPSARFRGVLLFNVLASIGAWIGIGILFWKRNSYAFPIAVFLVVFPWAFYLTLTSPRYRHPIDPVILLLTAVAGVWFVKRTLVSDRY